MSASNGTSVNTRITGRPPVVSRAVLAALPGTATEIAQATGHKRASVYSALEEQQRRGIIEPAGWADEVRGGHRAVRWRMRRTA